MANITHSTREAAAQIGVAPQSIRRYCDRFGRFLSPGASPGPGAARTLTPEDVYILQTIYALTQGGLSYEDVETQLETLTLPDVVDMGQNDGAITTPAVPEGLALLQQMSEALTALAQAHQDTQHLQAKIDALQSAQHAQEGAQRTLQEDIRYLRMENEDLRRRIGTPLLWMLLGAVIMGVIAAGLAVWLVSMAGT